MHDMKTDWIKMTDRRPTEQDLPVWAYKTGEQPYLCAITKPHSYWTHWRPAKADIPEPPREETQWDKDESAFRRYNHSGNGCSQSAAFTGWTKALNEYWHAALAYERAEVAKMLPKVISHDPAATVYHRPAWECVEQISETYHRHHQ
jgi:hypothetical protein